MAGEKRVEQIFRTHSFQMEHRIFHDLSLHTSAKFQLDTTFLTQAFAVIFEVKNISGILTFKENPPQLIREKFSGKVDSFESPATQLERNMALLREWFHQQNIHLPVLGVIVLAYPKQIVKVPPQNIKILFPNLIPPYIHTLSHYQKKLDIHMLDLLTNKLLKSHQEYIPPPICENYSIPKEDIQTGVICPTCKYIGMNKIPRSWHCPQCRKNNPLAHIQTIREWFLIMEKAIKNRDCRAFLQIDNLNTASRILKNMNLNATGTFKDRSYQMDFLH
ncbi:nuclease-related domain-containing protein [Bacillus sp. J14TS2]|uniref:nuclease-related domain-containing protein n=1 Tax=Bacillus sp. J14TS2 TaxID=2807188 RepID=UPI001BB34CC8|nr:nuclease-related domain-containing protein [Bacillus sp. J14TS2]